MMEQELVVDKTRIHRKTQPDRLELELMWKGIHRCLMQVLLVIHRSWKTVQLEQLVIHRTQLQVLQVIHKKKPLGQVNHTSWMMRTQQVTHRS